MTHTDKHLYGIFKADFRLIGIRSRLVGTMQHLQTDKYTFWGDFIWSIETGDSFLKWAKDDEYFWCNGWIANCHFDEYSKDGCPINPKIVSVREWDLPSPPYPLPNNYKKF